MAEQEQPEQQGSNVSEFNRYLNNNTDILREKYSQFYQAPFPLAQLTQPPHLEHSFDFIYDVFNFGKYRDNEALNLTLRTSLQVNITDFQQNQTDFSFEPEMAIRLLKYCIQHNEMFAVHYDKKQAAQQSSEARQEGNRQEEHETAQHSPQKNQEGQEKEEEEEDDQEKEKEEENIGQKEDIEERESMPPVNEFDSPQLARPDRDNSEMIKKQLKGVFEFYCKQQQSVGPKSTFDNINHKCQAMNLGKFMTFSIAANILHSKDKAYSEGKLEKNQLMSVFKKAAGGVREIGFPVFMNIIEQLAKIDASIHDKLGLGEEGLKGRDMQKLKYINLPFNTRDPQGRLPSPKRVFIPKLTAHSGKYEDALRDELSSRKQRATERAENRAESKMGLSYINRTREQERSPDSTKFTLKLGQSNDSLERSDLNFLSKLITTEDNDEIFLKDYQLPSSNNSRIREKSQQVILPESRYQEETGSLGQMKQLGLGQMKQLGFTTRPKKRSDFELPSITQRGGQTQLTSQRRSLPPRRMPPRVPLG